MRLQGSLGGESVSCFRLLIRDVELCLLGFLTDINIHF